MFYIFLIIYNRDELFKPTTIIEIHVSMQCKKLLFDIDSWTGLLNFKIRFGKEYLDLYIAWKKSSYLLT